MQARNIPYSRTVRISSILKIEVSRIIRELNDPGIGFITVTDAKISPDLSEARIYFSVLGDEKEKDETSQALHRASGFIRGCLSKILSLRKIPEIKFIYDGTPATASRIFSILEKIRNEKKIPRKKTARKKKKGR
ncbi:MAG: 30S ribosome-binding factor RbfA [Elusimicrobia bacterium]|nr:30S ribosome-binding factor RbfA [Elusimicrobiota bacterium]